MPLVSLVLLALAASYQPRSYLCQRVESAPTIDGRLDDKAWSRVAWSQDFADIEGLGKPKPRYQTRVKMLWDSECLYIGANLEEPNVWATLKDHDSIIFQDNDFEVFIDPNWDEQLYAEFEMNALNTTWDLLLAKPYRAGGPPIYGFELSGIRTAVHVDGTLNQPSDRDRGWTVEIAIPWVALGQIAGTDCPPKVGDQWRIDFSRVEWDVRVENGRTVKIANRPEHNWVWSPTGVIDMHRPERWGVVQFADGPASYRVSPMIEAGRKLNAAWDAQMAFRGRHGRWGSASELGLGNEYTVSKGMDHFEIRLGGATIDDGLRLSGGR